MATIIDVAKKAGVSFKTVSRVFNGEARVKPETRAKVLEAAKALNYQVNFAARNLRSKAQRKLALIMDNPSQSYSEAIQIGAMLSTQAQGLQLIFAKSLDSLAAHEDYVGAILCPPLSNNDVVLKKLAERNIPFVRIGAERNSEAGDRIGVDDRQAAKEMTEYLISLGHKRIGFIKGDPAYDVSRRRLAGFQDAMEAAGLKISSDFVVQGDFSYISGLSATETLLSQNPRPTAIFASNDEMASACLATAYKMNIRVPDALSVAGYDDAPVSRTIYPHLTTVRQSPRDMVEKAVELLASRVSTPDRTPAHVIFPHLIMKRESVAAPQI